MPNTIDIFNNSVKTDKLITSKITSSNSLEELNELNIKQERFLSSIDYQSPRNFARFGSAEQYYKNAITYISNEFPYDGSGYEYNKWINSLNDFEFYLYKKEYPKAVGYVNLSQSQQIVVYSHVQSPTSTEAQGIYDFKKYSDITNIQLSGSSGICLETWLNSVTSSNESRILSINALSASNVGFTNTEVMSLYVSASQLHLYDNFSNQITFTQNIPSNEWHHYSLNITTSSVDLFVDGVIKEIVPNTSLNFLSNLYTFTEKGLILQNLNNIVTSLSSSKQPVFLLGSGSLIKLDDARLWNNTRTVEQIGRNWFTSVYGNDNTATLNTDLLFYFKFNEGWDPEYGNLCIDYSGKKNDSYIYSYNQNCRSSESGINLSGIVQDLEKPEIIVSGLQFSTTVKDFYNLKNTIAVEHDENNIHMLYNKFPSWILEQEEDQDTKHLKQIIQIISSYFDDLYNKISEVTNYKKTFYASDLDNVYPFYDKILTSMGFDVTDILNNMSSLENITSRNDKTIFDEDVKKVKNMIFKNIYNNLVYIFKSKGTEKSLRALLRSYGISEDVVRINLYADKAAYGVKDRSKETVVKKKTVTMTGSNSIYLSGSSIPDTNYYTLESCLAFPNNSQNIQETSLFGINNTDNDYYVSLFYVAKDIYKFKLYHSNSSGINQQEYALTSSNIYDNTPWNLCLRKKPTVDTVIGAVTPLNYTIELYGVNNNTNPVAEFSCSLPYYTGSSGLQYYIGAKKQNLNGSLVLNTNCKFLYCNFWSDYLNNDIVKSHNKDILNYGVDG